MDVVNILVTGGVILGVIFGAGLIARWFGVIGDDDTAEQGTRRIERGQQDQERQPGTDAYRIPLRDKPKQLPLEMKILSVAILLLAVVFAWYTYQFYQTGNPQEFAYANRLKDVGLVLMGMGAMVVYLHRKQSTWGKFTVLYESRDGESVVDKETYYYDATNALTVDGNMYVQELWPTTILGVWRRRKLTGHYRQLRGDRPLGDPVTHEIPEHAVQLDDHEWEFRTQGQNDVPVDKDKPADFEYEAPIRLPNEEHVRRRERMTELRSRNQSLSTQLSAVWKNFYDLQRLVENEQYNSKQEILDEIKEVQRVASTSQHHYRLGGNYQPQRHPQAVNGQQGGGQQPPQRHPNDRGGDRR